MSEVENRVDVMVWYGINGAYITNSTTANVMKAAGLIPLQYLNLPLLQNTSVNSNLNLLIKA